MHQNRMLKPASTHSARNKRRSPERPGPFHFESPDHLRFLVHCTYIAPSLLRFSLSSLLVRSKLPASRGMQGRGDCGPARSWAFPMLNPLEKPNPPFLESSSFSTHDIFHICTLSCYVCHSVFHAVSPHLVSLVSPEDRVLHIPHQYAQVPTPTRSPAPSITAPKKVIMPSRPTMPCPSSLRYPSKRFQARRICK